MSMYSLFQTDSALENDGIILDYGSFRITVARAGGNNKKYIKALEAKTKPYKRAIQTDTLDQDKSLDILREVYAEAIIINWETKVTDKFVQGIEAQDGELLPFTKENVQETFRLLPDLFIDIQDQASKIALFRREMREIDAGNL